MGIANSVKTSGSSNTRGRWRCKVFNSAKRIINRTTDIAPRIHDIAREIEIRNVLSAKDTFSLGVFIMENP